MLVVNSVVKRQFFKMTILWSFSYNSFVKFHGEKNCESQYDHVVSKAVL